MNIFKTTLAIIAIGLPSFGYAQTQYFTYTTTNGTITITQYRGPDGAVTIPSTIDNLPVTQIGDYAFMVSGVTTVVIPNGVTRIGNYTFYSCARLTTITMPSSLTSIGASAFLSCTNLGSIAIPNGVTNIEFSAFAHCRRLTNITIPQSVTSLGSGAFVGCISLASINVDALNPAYSSEAGILFTKDLTTLLRCPEGKGGSYSIPDGVTSIDVSAFGRCRKLTGIAMPDTLASIGYGAFGDCTGLLSVEMPDSVTNIGDWAFEACTNLVKITMPNQLHSIAWGMFARCSNLAGVTIPDSVTNIANVAFIECHGLTKVTIPTNVTSIGPNAFQSCGSLTNITISNGLVSIGDWAFASCSSLPSVFVPASVTRIGASAFSGCARLTSISVDTLSATYSSRDGVLFDSGQTTLLQFPLGKAGDYMIPNTVATIGAGSFEDCISLTNVTVPGRVTNIAQFAFSRCAGLVGIEIPGAVTAIGYRSFAECIGLRSVTLGRGLTSIGDSAFSACRELSGVMIPDSVTYIGSEVFRDCDSLVEIGVDALNPRYSSVEGVLFNKQQSTLLQYPMGKRGSYIIPRSVSIIGPSAFNTSTGLTSVTIPGSVTNIGAHAFASCSGLAEIIVPSSVTAIEQFAFMNCTGLKGIYFEGGAPIFGALVFNGDYNATIFHLPGAMGWPSEIGGVMVALWRPPEGWVVTSAPTNAWVSVSCSADGVKILAAAQSGPGGGYGYGSLWSSTNSGHSWFSHDLPTNSWWSTAMSADGNRLFAVSGNFNPGVFISSDSGGTWRRTIPDPNITWTKIACSADGMRLVAGGNVFAVTDGGLWSSRAVVYTSTDSGVTWKPGFSTVTTVSNGGVVRSIRGLASSADGIRLAVIDTGPDYTGSLFTSRDGGSTWATNAVGSNTNVFPSFNSLACSADGMTLVLCRPYEMPGLFVSKDGGTSWERSLTNGIWSATCSAEGSWLSALDTFGVIHTSRDAGVAWMRNSLPYHPEFGFLSSSADGSKLIAALISAGICISEATPTPALQASISESNLALSWVVPSQTFALQQNVDVISTNWMDVTAPPALNHTNLHYEVRLPMILSGNLFYRLRLR